MQEMQDNLYKENGGKNMFYKNTQKNEIAKTVSQNFELTRLLNECIYIVKDNEIYLNYPALKLFIHEEIYEDIANHILSLYNESIAKYGNYSLNMNLQGFTISAAERYKNIIILFSNKCIQQTDIEYSNVVRKIRILNTPSVINMLIKMFKPFFSKAVEAQLEYYDKKETEVFMKTFGI